MNIPELFSLVVQIAYDSGERNLKESHKDRCWEKDIGNGWFVAINANDHNVECSRGGSIPPYSCYGEHNGMPAFLTDAAGGTVGHLGWFEQNDELIAIEALKEYIANTKGVQCELQQ